MKKRKEGVAVRRLDENRYAISLDQIKEALAHRCGDVRLAAGHEG